MKKFKNFLTESNDARFKEVYNKFIPHVKKELGINELPPINIVGKNESSKNKSFGWWDGKAITINPEGRHPIDTMRTLAHELVHATHGHTNGEDGSDHENEANAKAGVIMRRFGRDNPDLF